MWLHRISTLSQLSLVQCYVFNYFCNFFTPQSTIFCCGQRKVLVKDSSVYPSLFLCSCQKKGIIQEQFALVLCLHIYLVNIKYCCQLHSSKLCNRQKKIFMFFMQGQSSVSESWRKEGPTFLLKWVNKVAKACLSRWKSAVICKHTVLKFKGGG